MVTLFNRKELFITYDLQKKCNVCELLDNHNIDYDVKVCNLSSSLPPGTGGRRLDGTLGASLSHPYEYKIYVKKKEYEIAQAIIRGGVR